ncbi:hypothetical protein E3T23_08860 [Cryobacterium cheniae]|uniref:Uncharacterized protein n=1 Tax=Cryobacterium cheniae TaxID=1259262 RepID=A0A4V3II26_9MICO|nr:hypothetical protein [Cryobacterium cheniae]TFC80388.1 hypothetical protein E3T23_08860 [Cryobacterium cheniae]
MELRFVAAGVVLGSLLAGDLRQARLHDLLEHIVGHRAVRREADGARRQGEALEVSAHRIDRRG